MIFLFRFSFVSQCILILGLYASVGWSVNYFGPLTEISHKVLDGLPFGTNHTNFGYPFPSDLVSSSGENVNPSITFL